MTEPLMDQIAARVAAAEAIEQAFTDHNDLQSARVMEVLKVSPGSDVALCRLRGEKVIAKRYKSADVAQIVTNVEAELGHLSGHMSRGRNRVNSRLFVLPEAGVVVLSFHKGSRLDQVIAAAAIEDRGSLMRHAGEWLSAYCKERRRVANFAPRRFIRQIAGNDRSGMGADLQKTCEGLLANMRGRAQGIMGFPIEQAAVHGDYCGLNALYHEGAIIGLDIQGESWLPLAKEVARFLVWQGLSENRDVVTRRFGLDANDVAAFLDAGVLSETEHHSILPFFVAEQVFLRLQEFHPNAEVAARLRAMALALMSEPAEGG